MSDRLRSGLVRATWAALLVLAGTLVRAGADDALVSQVENLVRRLDAASRAERLAAEQGLVELGPKILPLLPTEPQTTGHPLNRVRRTLDARRQTELLAPVTIPQIPGQATVGDLLDRLQKRFGPSWDSRSIPEAERSRPWGQEGPRSFWEAMAALERNGNDRPDGPVLKFVSDEGGGEDRWTLAPRAAGERPAILAPAGAYGVRLRRDDSRAGIEVLSQPGIRGLLVFWDLRRLRWTETGGATRLPKTPEAQYELPWTDAGRSPRLTVEFGAAVPGQPDDKKSPAGLSGEFEVIATAGEDRFRFDEALVSKPARPFVRRIGRTTVTVDRPELQTTASGTTARFVVLTTRHAEVAETTARGERIVPAVTLESHQFGLVPHAARLVSTTSGKTLAPTSTVRAEFFSPGTTRAEYEFQAIPDPAADWVLECTTTAVLGRERVRFVAAEFAEPDRPAPKPGPPPPTSD